MPDTTREDACIKLFCERLARLEGVRVDENGSPERDPSLRVGSRPIDRFITRGGIRHALEHTTIDFLPGERKHRNHFLDVVVPLEERLTAEFPDSSIDVSVPFGAVVLPKRKQRERLRVNLETGCIEQLRKMPREPRRPQRRHLVRVHPDVPFDINLVRWKPEGRPGRCFVSVLISGDDATGRGLRENLRKAIGDKSDQLAPYREKGYPTILLLESDYLDVKQMAEAFVDPAAQTEAARSKIDEIFVCSILPNAPESIWFCPVKLGSRLYPNLPEFEEFWDKQYVMNYGPL